MFPSNILTGYESQLKSIHIYLKPVPPCQIPFTLYFSHEGPLPLVLFGLAAQSTLP